MSEWITDRNPTKEDADASGFVWAMSKNGDAVLAAHWALVKHGSPWMPTNRPDPYVKPKKYIIEEQSNEKYSIYCECECYARNIPTRQAAERIAAIYGEVTL